MVFYPWTTTACISNSQAAAAQKDLSVRVKFKHISSCTKLRLPKNDIIFIIQQEKNENNQAKLEALVSLGHKHIQKVYDRWGWEQLGPRPPPITVPEVRDLDAE